MRESKQTAKDAATIAVGVPVVAISAWASGLALAFAWVVFSAADRVTRHP